MTVIAWDGKILAADRMISGDVIGREGTKLHRVGDDTVLAWTGQTDFALDLIDWYVSGQDKATWPAYQETDDWVQLVIVSPSGCRFLCQRPHPLPVIGKMAWGSGGNIAIGAMAAGKNAIEAVKIANIHCISCGFGVDWFEVPK